MKSKALIFAILVLVCAGANSADVDVDQANFTRAPVGFPEFYDPFGGDFVVQLQGFIYGLFQSQTKDSTEPADINDVPLVTLTDSPGLYDNLLQP